MTEILKFKSKLDMKDNTWLGYLTLLKSGDAIVGFDVNGDMSMKIIATINGENIEGKVHQIGFDSVGSISMQPNGSSYVGTFSIHDPRGNINTVNYEWERTYDRRAKDLAKLALTGQ